MKWLGKKDETLFDRIIEQKTIPSILKEDNPFKKYFDETLSAMMNDESTEIMDPTEIPKIKTKLLRIKYFQQV